MDFIHHTLQWCKGEIFEGKISLLFGILILLVSLSYWKWGTTAYARAMFWPLLVVAFLAAGAGVYLIRTNQKRIVAYQEAFRENPDTFLDTEKERTADFIKWYPYTQKIFLGVMVVGMLCMILSHSPGIRAIGIAVMLLSFYVFVLDHFSEERAHLYHSRIIEHLTN